MQQHEITMARGWRKIVVGGSLVLLGLAVTGLPESHAQMRYSGGFTPTRRPRQQTGPKSAAPQTTTPAAPKTPRDYFPDSDLSYPSYYPGEEPKRSLSSPASLLPYSIPSSSLPWNQAGFEDYNESLQLPRDASLGEAKKYSLAATPLPSPVAAERSRTAVLITHLPSHAVFWVEGTRTRSTGQTRYFQSPPLLPGRKYNYRIRAAWIEDGHWVSQTRMVPVEAGTIQAIYLQPVSP